MPGTVLLLAASPVGKGRLVDAASVLPVLAAVDPAVLAGTDTANVVELADPLEPQAVLTRLRAAATAPGPLTVFVTGQLQLDRKQHLPHLALARTTPATVRYTAFPWAWVREELRLRAPGTTTLLLDLHTDAETWQWLHTHPLDSGRTNAVYGRIAPPPARRSVSVPSYMKAVATILRSGWRPPVEQLHQQAVERLGAETYADVVLSAPGVGAPGTTGAGVPGGFAPRPPSALKGPRPQTPDGLVFAGLSGESAPQTPGSAGRGQDGVPPGQEGAGRSHDGVPRAPEGARRSPDNATPSQDSAPQTPEGARRTRSSAARSQEGARPDQEGARQGRNSAPAGPEGARRSRYGAPPSPGSAPPSPGSAPPSHDSTPPRHDNDPHLAVASAAQDGRHLDADALAAEHEEAAVRAHGQGSEEALHWTEVRADLAMLAGDPVRSCRAWIAVAGARLAAGQAPGTAVVEAAVDRAHHQWGLIQEPVPARELGLALAELRGRVPGRRKGALDHVRQQLRQLQSQPLNS
ncbi:hypothetical protein [Streptomyces sp. NBC_00986]|uniref:hypothetical protein n=1 Tax=Streptomyces sp. NBC_00986 TaxID=2903702 RepID=UPI003866BE38|nr:hypothetical protein OG504_26350 [Streptomyces sp. NBC_00986]